MTCPRCHRVVRMRDPNRLTQAGVHRHKFCYTPAQIRNIRAALDRMGEMARQLSESSAAMGAALRRMTP